MNEPMTFLDFFSGVGGFRKGFELCGMVCKGHCEIDKFADRSYRAIHDVKEDEWYGEDITKTEPGRPAEGQPLGRRIPVSGHFCIWPTARACRQAKLSLF